VKKACCLPTFLVIDLHSAYKLENDNGIYSRRCVISYGPNFHILDYVQRTRFLDVHHLLFVYIFISVYTYIHYRKCTAESNNLITWRHLSKTKYNCLRKSIKIDDCVSEFWLKQETHFRYSPLRPLTRRM